MVRLDYFIGRTLSEITDGPNGWDWIVRLDGNTTIRNKDTSRTATPSGTIGATVINVEAQQDGSIALCCGGAGRNPDGTLWSSTPTEIYFTPGQYTIADQFYTQGEEYAEAAVVFELPPHPDERVAEGPEISSEEQEAVNGQAGEAEAAEGQGGTQGAAAV